MNARTFWWLYALVLVAVVAGAVAWAQPAPPYFQAQNEAGQIMYQGPDQYRAFQSCSYYTVRDQARMCTWTHIRSDGKRSTLKVYNSARVGVWEWVAPTRLENGDIMTDLSHYLIYRQPAGGQPTVWAQIMAPVVRAILPMGPEHWGGCFWITAVRKPGTSPPVESDRSNTICMDAQGQPLPST